MGGQLKMKRFRIAQRQEAKLDASLETQAQKTVAGLVSQLEDETPTLTWRSELNERLLKVGRSRPRQQTLIWKTAFGLGLAACLAWVALTVRPLPTGPSTVASPSSQSLEAQLLEVHEQHVNVRLVAGSGLLNHIESEPAPDPSAAIQWSESDLGVY